jgi:SAM-dependent methyltransferase
MPFLLPRAIWASDRIAFVLAFGDLSNLEACSILGGEISKLETPCERVSVITVRRSAASLIPRLAGAHKAAPLIETVDEKHTEPSLLVGAIAEHLDAVPTLSVSGYGIGEDDYEVLVRVVLDEFRKRGFKKTHLLRPKGNELVAGDVLSRKALDVIAFPYRGAYGLGPTAWVPDSAPLRERGTQKPAPLSEISLSPRLASLLLNLASLSPGEVVLDPFCGSGTILSEALLRSCKCLGFDSNERRVRDARRNLSWTASGLRGADFNVRVGDARELPSTLGRTRVDAVVTEPLLLPTFEARPRTETAAVLVDEASGIYADALASAAEVLAPGGKIVIVVPIVTTMEGKEVSITLDGKPLGLKLFQPSPIAFDYPVRPSFESTRWIRRGVYVFESRP